MLCTGFTILAFHEQVPYLLTDWLFCKFNQLHYILKLSFTQ